ncbi:MAG: hypothetical protein Q7K65_02315 [Candidatus Buchananbacteria bacterium]|nr:hypothetical protein [Candidatus Buchananbacteria bacterium]
MPYLSTESLCLAKMLLIKGDYLSNSPVTIDLIEKTTGIKAPYIAKALGHLLKLRIITIQNLQLDKRCVATTTLVTCKKTGNIIELVNKKLPKVIKAVNDYLEYVETCYDPYSGEHLKDKPTEATSFLLNFNKNKLSEFIDSYLADYRANMFATKNKLFFKGRKEGVRSFLVNTVNAEVSKLKAKEKKLSNISLVLNCNSDDQLPHDIVEILMLMENDNNIIITSIDIFTHIDVDPEQGNATISRRCNKVGLIITDWMNNKLLEKDNNNDLSFRHRFIVENGMSKSYLQINDYQEIPHTKKPALIINYFYNKIKYDKTFKNFHDFNKSLPKTEKDITSDDFTDRINNINKRVRKVTDGVIDEIIIKGENDAREANIYRWLID